MKLWKAKEQVCGTQIISFLAACTEICHENVCRINYNRGYYMENKENRQEPSMVKTLGIVKMFRLIGPGIIIAASIIGPGTVTTTSSTGAKYGYMLLWCCIVSAILAYILN